MGFPCGLKWWSDYLFSSALHSQLRYSREIMDIFSFAYPTPDVKLDKKKPTPADLFMEIRDQLDVGYVTIGIFQDLARR